MVLAKFSILLILALPAFGKRVWVPWETGLVVSQDQGAEKSGNYQGPLFGGQISMPLYARWNLTVIECDGYQYALAEPGRNLLILPINDEIQFYRDDGQLVMLDQRGRKHKFNILKKTRLLGP